MGNTDSAPETAFDFDEPAPTNNDSVNSATFYKGQEVPYPGGAYVGATVSDPNPAGHNGEIELEVPTLGGNGGFVIRFPKSAVLEEMESVSDPLDEPDDEHGPNVMPAPIGCGPCGVCCWSPVLFFQPRRALATIFCWANVFLLMYIIVALGLLSSMDELCHYKRSVEFEPGFTGGNRFLQEQYETPAATAADYVPPAEAAAESDYKAPAAESDYKAPAAESDYKAHTAYNVASYTSEHVGPACNRLVSFLTGWSILMSLGVTFYGCCVFRHWHHDPHIVGFWIATLFFLAFDFFSIALVFAVDANHIRGIRDPMYFHGDRRLKVSKNFLDQTWEYECVAAFMAFIMSYIFLVFGLNIWRYHSALISDWNKPRAATVEKFDDTSMDTGRDYRISRRKSNFYSEEFDSQGAFDHGGAPNMIGLGNKFPESSDAKKVGHNASHW